MTKRNIFRCCYIKRNILQCCYIKRSILRCCHINRYDVTFTLMLHLTSYHYLFHRNKEPQERELTYTSQCKARGHFTKQPTLSSSSK